MLNDFLKVWDEVSKFIAPEFRPAIVLKDDYCPYGSNMPLKAAIFNEKYAAFESFREGVSFVDPVVRLETIEPEPHIKERYEAKGMDPSIISDTSYYFTAFMLLDSISVDFQDKLRAEGKK